MHEQLRALWKSRDSDQAFVKGLLLTKNTPIVSRPYEQGSNKLARSQLVEKSFTLIGHTLFYCKHTESPDFAGALLTDIFSPVLARVSQKIVDAFELPEAHQVMFSNGIYSNGCSFQPCSLLAASLLFGTLFRHWKAIMGAGLEVVN